MRETDGEARRGSIPSAVQSALPVAVLLGLVLTLFPSAGCDDLHITFWPCRTLAELGEMVNYSFERVEQTTTLGLVLLLAGLHRLTSVDFSILARLLTVLVSAVCVFALTRRARGAPEPAHLPTAAAWLLATATYFVYWSGSGMEATLIGAVYLGTAVALHRLVRAGRHASLALVAALAAAVSLRSEALFVLGSGLCGALVLLLWARPDGAVRRSAVRRTACALLLLGAGWGAVALFRYLYFGDVFPQPVHVKATRAPLSVQIPRGLRYLLGESPGDPGLELHHLAPLLLVAALGLCVALRALRRGGSGELVVFAAMFGAAELAFAVAVGGDWMGYGRFLVPGIPCLAVVAAAALHAAPRALARAGLVLLLSIQLFSVYDIAVGGNRINNKSRPLWAGAVELLPEGTLPLSWHEKNNRINIRDTRVLAFLDALITEAVRREWPGPLRYMSGQMGFVPYHLVRRHGRKLEIQDLSALTDPRWARVRHLQLNESMTPTEAIRSLGGAPPDIVYTLAYQERPPGETTYVKVYDRQGTVIRDRDGNAVQQIRELACVSVSAELHRFLGEEFFRELRARMK
jgi:hypothetical protein